MAFTDPSTSQPNTTAPGASNQSVPSWDSILNDPNFIAAKDWEKVAAAQKYYNKYFVTDPNFIAASEEDQAEATRRFQSTVPVEPSVWRAATRGVLETLGGVAGIAQAGAQAVGLGPDTWLGEKLSYGKNLLKAEAGLIVRPPDERPYTEDWWQPWKMAEDVAQAIPGVALAVAGGLPYRASTATATAVASGIGGLLEGEGQYQELTQRGATPEQALLGMLEMTLTSAGLNALPFAKFFGKGWSTKKLVNAVSQGLAEAASEYGEEIGSAVITQAALKNGLEPGEFMARLKQGIEVTIPAFLLGAGMGTIGGNGKVVPKGAEPAPGTEETGTPSTGTGEAPSTPSATPGAPSTPVSDEMRMWNATPPDRRLAIETYEPAKLPLELQEQEDRRRLGYQSNYARQENQRAKAAMEAAMMGGRVWEEPAPGLDPIEIISSLQTSGWPAAVLAKMSGDARAVAYNRNLKYSPESLALANSEGSKLTARREAAQESVRQKWAETSPEAQGETNASQPAIDTPLKGIDAQKALKSLLHVPISIRVTDKKGKEKFVGEFIPTKIRPDGRVEGLHEVADSNKQKAFTYSMASIEILPSASLDQNFRPILKSTGSEEITNPLQQPSYPKVGMSKPQFSMAEEGTGKQSLQAGETYTLGDPTDLHQVIHDLPDGTQVRMSAGYNRMYEAVKRVFPNLDISVVARIERMNGDKYQGDALGSVVDRFVRIAIEDMEVGETEDQVVARLGDKAGLTLGHEGLHVLIAALGPNDDLVATGLAQYGSEEALVQKAAEHYARLVNGEPVPDLTFAQWLKSIWEKFVRSIRSLSVKDRAELLAARMYEGGFDKHNLPGWHTVFGEHLRGSEFGPTFDSLIKSLQEWYSQMQRALESKLPNSGTAQSFKSLIQSWGNKGEFKNEELEWSGLFTDPTSPLAKDGKVTKQEVVDWLAENNVRVEEVQKGQETDANEASAIIRQFESDMRIKYGADFKNSLTAKERVHYSDLQKNLDTAQEFDPTKFSQYQTPGGSNYREILITLGDKVSSRYSQAREIVNAGIADQIKLSKKYGMTFREASELAARERAGAFTKSHWDEPNVLVHLRVNDRVDADGKRVLFVEEVQSDWGEKGREEGFVGGADKVDVSGWRIEREASVAGRPFVSVYNKAGELISVQRGATIEQATDEEILKRAKEQVAKDSGKHPRAPFVERTSSWMMLGMKKAIRIAAEGGYDRIAWTTGEQQADRYDLSKQVDELNIKKYSKGDKAGTYGVIATRGNEQVFSEQGLSAEQLKDYVGKEHAERAVREIEEKSARPAADMAKLKEESDKAKAAMESAWRKIEAMPAPYFGEEGPEYKQAMKEFRPLEKEAKRLRLEYENALTNEVTYSGLDLKVGGEGMKAFYDKMLPNEVNKYVKKWGGKVGETGIETDKPGDVYQDASSRRWFVDAGVMDTERSFATKEEAFAALKGAFVHSLDITPSMHRTVVSEGQPLFSQRSKDDLLKELAEVEQWLAAPPTTGGKPASPAMIKRFEAKRDNLYRQITATPSFSMKEASDNAPGFREATTVHDQLRALASSAANVGKWAADAFSVEAPFLRTGEKLGELIGEQARRYQSVQTGFNDHTIYNIAKEGIIRTLAPLYQKQGSLGASIANTKLGQAFAPLLGIDKPAWTEALDNFALIHESKQAREDFLRANPDKAAAYTRAFKIVDDYIAESLELLKQHGVTDDFKARAIQMAHGEIATMKEEIASWQAKLARTHSANIRSQLEPKIAENKKNIAELEDRLNNLADLNYLPMPTSLILNSGKLMGTKRGRMAAIRFLTAKQRGDVKMADLLKKVDPDTGKPYFEKSDFSIIKVLSSYSYKVGRDLGMARVLNAALGRKFMIDERTGKGHFVSVNTPKGELWAYKMRDPDEPLRKGFVRLRTSHGSYIEDYALREPLASWFESQAFRNLDETLAPIWRFWSAIKMAQFYNPFILPAYNVYQAWMAGGALSLFKGRVWKKAWNSAVNRDEHWAAMQHYGGFSHPFADTANSLLDTMNRMARTNPKLHGLMNLGLPIQAVKHAYSISQDAAWHMDRFTRMFTYFHLMDMGLDSERAAKRAAEYMGDYANCPQGTRVFLNKLFFTPTFKIATARMQKNMVKAAITHARNTLQGKDTPYETASMSHALIWSAGALFLTNMLMRTFGFKDERWGWKYVKNVETEEGPKQLVITWSNPINLLPKYGYRWQDAANPAETNSIQRWLDSTSWELHPIWRTVSSLVQNRNERGEAIVNPFDSFAKIQGDRSWYFFSRTIPMFKWFQDTFWPNTTLDSKEAVRVLDKNVNTAFAYLMRAAAFPYLRSSADQRAASQMNKLIIEYRVQMRRNLRNTDPAHWDKAFKREEERMKRLQEKLDQVWQIAQESNQKLD